MSEKHHEMIEGPEAAARETRNHIEQWLDHSRRALEQADTSDARLMEAPRVL